jgi:murein DD-endopeptidase MepM/ murein hydrolase activator NlpD
MSLPGSGRALVERVTRTLRSAHRKPARAMLVAAIALGMVGVPAALAQSVLAIPRIAAPGAPPSPPSPPSEPAPPAEAAPPSAPAPAAPPSPPAPAAEPAQYSRARMIYAPMQLRVASLSDGARGKAMTLETVATDGINQGCEFRLRGVTDVRAKQGDVIPEGEIVGKVDETSYEFVNCRSTNWQLSNWLGKPKTGPHAIPDPQCPPGSCEVTPVRQVTPPTAVTPVTPVTPPTPRPAPAPSPAPVAIPAPRPAPAPTAAPVDVRDMARLVPVQYAVPAELRVDGSAAVLDVAARLTMPFGYQTDPFNPPEQRFHEGVDLAAAPGTVIHTPADGVVTFADVRGTYGRVVEVDMGNGVKMRFGHLEAIKVEAGATLKAGDTVGTMGNSGLSTGYHLHLELFWKGKSYDPEKVTGLRLTSAN